LTILNLLPVCLYIIETISMNYTELIELIKKKDKKGLEYLFTDYGEKLYSYAIYQWFLSEDKAWDVVYKTLDTLLLKLPGYKLESSRHFNNLIFKIFKNNLRQSYRDSRRSEEKLEFVALDDFAADSVNQAEEDFAIEPTVFTDYYKNEVLESPLFAALKLSLEKLEPREKDLLLLKAQNYSYDEIASMLKTDAGPLKMRHSRALRKLREYINKQQKGVL